MSILVTGGTGHVGAAVVQRAVRAGHKVVASVRDPRKVPESLRMAVGDAVKWIGCDLSNPFEIAALAAEHRIEGCIHAGAVPNQKLAVAAPWDAIQTNVTGTAALLEVAHRQGWRRFICVSTGSVFQTETDWDKPLTEGTPVSPLSVYGATKHSGELITRMYRHDYGLSTATVRISFLYGPPLVPRVRDLPRGPVVDFLRLAMLGVEIDEPTGGDFMASFTYIDDVAAGLLAAYHAPTLNHNIYHLGNGRNWTVFDVANAVRAAVPEARIRVGAGVEPWTKYNPMRGPLSGSNLLDDTGFECAFPLEAGVSAFAEWMRKNMAELT